MPNLNESINRMKFLMGFKPNEVISEQHNGVISEQGGETQDITGPFALAGSLHDCYVYEYNSTTEDIQKYKSTGEKDHFYKYNGNDDWGGSDRQNGKFRKAINSYMNHSFKGGVFKAKPWQGAEKAAEDITAALETVGKPYCGAKQEETDPTPAIDEAWFGTWQVEGVTVDSASYVDGSPMIMKLINQNESGDIIGSGCNCNGSTLDCAANENGFRYLVNGEEVDELYKMRSGISKTPTQYILDVKRFVALFGSKPNEGKYKVNTPDPCKKEEEPLADLGNLTQYEEPDTSQTWVDRVDRE